MGTNRGTSCFGRLMPSRLREGSVYQPAGAHHSASWCGMCIICPFASHTFIHGSFSLMFASPEGVFLSAPATLPNARIPSKPPPSAQAPVCSPSSSGYRRTAETAVPPHPARAVEQSGSRTPSARGRARSVYTLQERLRDQN